MSDDVYPKRTQFRNYIYKENPINQKTLQLYDKVYFFFEQKLITQTSAESHTFTIQSGNLSFSSKTDMQHTIKDF